MAPEEEVTGDDKVSELCQITNTFIRFIGKWSRGGNRTKQETQTNQTKSKDVLPDVSTEEEMKHKEEERAERKQQVQLRLVYQVQKLKIEQ